MTAATEQRQSFQLKGSLFTLSVLQLNDCNIAKLREALNEKIKLAPKFFQYAPIVLDLHHIKESEVVDFAALRNLLTEFKLVPVGIRGGNQAMQTTAQLAGFAVMIDPTPQSAKPAPVQKNETSVESTPAQTEPQIREKTPTFGSRLITTPIRSGQQVYAHGGDLIVAASVSPGAELLADGNIHVYGTLRGRALAGINGNQDARIFCKGLEAELISIAGQYKVFEEHLHSPGAKQMFLRDGQLIISPL